MAKFDDQGEQERHAADARVQTLPPISVQQSVRRMLEHDQLEFRQLEFTQPEFTQQGADWCELAGEPSCPESSCPEFSEPESSDPESLSLAGDFTEQDLFESELAQEELAQEDLAREIARKTGESTEWVARQGFSVWSPMRMHSPVTAGPDASAHASLAREPLGREDPGREPLGREYLGCEPLGREDLATAGFAEVPHAHLDSSEPWWDETHAAWMDWEAYERQRELAVRPSGVR